MEENEPELQGEAYLVMSANANTSQQSESPSPGAHHAPTSYLQGTLTMRKDVLTFRPSARESKSSVRGAGSSSGTHLVHVIDILAVTTAPLDMAASASLAAGSHFVSVEQVCMFFLFVCPGAGVFVCLCVSGRLILEGRLHMLVTRRTRPHSHLQVKGKVLTVGFGSSKEAARWAALLKARARRARVFAEAIFEANILTRHPPTKKQGYTSTSKWVGSRRCRPRKP